MSQKFQGNETFNPKRIQELKKTQEKRHILNNSKLQPSSNTGTYFS